jgi:hypothetical protein
VKWVILKKAIMVKLLFLCFLPLAAIFQTPDNQLTDAEKKQGWILLFDGKSTENWRTYKNLPDNSWEIVDGQLHCKSDAQGVSQRADLVTIKSYDRFEIQIDWKVEKGANSGLLYRVQETQKDAYDTGPEYQMIDDLGYNGKLEDWQKSGADYAMHPPSMIMSKPAGEYNHTLLVVNGPHIEHWLNGMKVADFQAWTPEWEKLKANGKWKDYPEYGISKTGLIDLQNHGGGVWIKNVKVREIR